MEKYKFINYEINKEKKCCLKRIGRQKKNEKYACCIKNVKR